MNGRWVTVVKTNTMEILGSDFSVFFHVSPQIWAVFRLITITQLHTVSPANELSSQVNIWTCKGNKCIIVYTYSTEHVPKPESEISFPRTLRWRIKSLITISTQNLRSLHWHTISEYSKGINFYSDMNSSNWNKIPFNSSKEYKICTWGEKKKKEEKGSKQMKEISSWVVYTSQIEKHLSVLPYRNCHSPRFRFHFCY